MDKRYIIESLGFAETPAQVDSVWQELAALDPATRRDFVDAIEDAYVQDFVQEASGYSAGWEKLLPKADEGIELIAEAEKILQQYQAVGQIMLYVAREKGEEAHPVIQEFARQSADMSTEDYTSLRGQINLMVKVRDALSMPPKSPGRHVAPEPAPPSAPLPKKKSRSFDI